MHPAGKGDNHISLADDQCIDPSGTGHRVDQDGIEKIGWERAVGVDVVQDVSAGCSVNPLVTLDKGEGLHGGQTAN